MKPPASLQLTDEASVRAALAGDVLFFKHSQICPTSDRAAREWHAFVQDHPDVTTGWIDVIAGRTLSRWVAEHTGVRHESPQALLVRDGRVVWHASHHDVTADALERAVASS